MKRIVMIIAGFLLVMSRTAMATEKPNVNFNSVDDLRPEINCFGAKRMHPPNFDRLASQGMIFERAYCQQAVCTPSRKKIELNN